MSDNSAIEWTDASWNPVTGCDVVTPGCDNCYAKTFAERWRGIPGHYFEQGFDVTLRPDKLDQPLRWKKPRRIFVNSMSDLFHKDVPDEYIARVFAVMAATPQHTYQLLTKRHGRMRSLLNDECRCGAGHVPGVHFKSAIEWAATPHSPTYVPGLKPGLYHRMNWPLKNLWLGVSVEDQKRADLRIPALLDTPAWIRWLSCEPLLGPVDLARTDKDALVDGGIDWVAVGGESGHGARPMHPDWARGLRDQCTDAGIPFFFKQHGQWAPLGPLYGDLDETDQGHLEAVHLEVAEGKSVVQMESTGYIAEGHQPGDPRTWLMGRVGKKRAGRELDGRTWDEYPVAPHGIPAPEAVTAR